MLEHTGIGLNFPLKGILSKTSKLNFCTSFSRFNVTNWFNCEAKVVISSELTFFSESLLLDFDGLLSIGLDP